MIYTTLNKIKACRPSEKGWTKLLSNLGKTEADDEPLGFDIVLASNGLDDALWCCRSVPEYDKTWRLYAVWCSRQVQHHMKDQRSITALDVAEKHAHGLATDEELAAASSAAWAAAMDVAWVVPLSDVTAIASNAAWDAASAAVRDAAWAAAIARVATCAVTRDVARKAQEVKFIEMINQV